mmetsp:Transcript_9721/g.58986  ORF Transcript_9721/g.58986 Transcript_9721/m.58986 type:complete len:272 (-) Transcript_9721:1650-2465(-)
MSKNRHVLASNRHLISFGWSVRSSISSKCTSHQKWWWLGLHANCLVLCLQLRTVVAFSRPRSYSLLRADRFAWKAPKPNRRRERTDVALPLVAFARHAGAAARRSDTLARRRGGKRGEFADAGWWRCGRCFARCCRSAAPRGVRESRMRTSWRAMPTRRSKDHTGLQSTMQIRHPHRWTDIRELANRRTDAGKLLSQLLEACKRIRCQDHCVSGRLLRNIRVPNARCCSSGVESVCRKRTEHARNTLRVVQRRSIPCLAPGSGAHPEFRRR